MINLKEKNITKEDALEMLQGITKRGSFGSCKNKVINYKDGSYLSYNADTDQGKETALVRNGTYFILLGDYRKEVKGCKNYYDVVDTFVKLINKGAKVSPWSNYE